MIGDALDRLREFISLVTLVVVNPSWNIRAAIALYAAFGVLLLLIVVIALLFVLDSPDSDAVPAAEPASPEREAPRKPDRIRQSKPPRSPRARASLWAGALLALLLVWVAAGYSTSAPSACSGCHADAHSAADKDRDPHSAVACVSCHEGAGAGTRYFSAVPWRLVHFAAGMSRSASHLDYGRVTARSCSGCHSRLSRVATNAERGLRVSHAEPMKAGATCIDCHRVKDGVIGIHNAGMKPCLRCHDDVKAKAACGTCHVARGSAAARARSTSFRNDQIGQPTCGGCHDQKRECDSCHGTRMPHSADFMSHTHARAAAVDFWYNGGKGCRKCHTETRRPCRCHTAVMGSAHGNEAWMATTHRSASSPHCNSCHAQYAYVATRDFCRDVCHSPAAIAASPR